LDFNITQSTDDRLLLEAINLYFKKKGGVYDKPNNVSVVAFRNVKVLKEIITPFFNLYPLVGLKSYELEH
jgi:LAGLIDADG endonuclease